MFSSSCLDIHPDFCGKGFRSASEIRGPALLRIAPRSFLLSSPASRCFDVQARHAPAHSDWDLYTKKSFCLFCEETKASASAVPLFFRMDMRPLATHKNMSGHDHGDQPVDAYIPFVNGFSARSSGMIFISVCALPRIIRQLSEALAGTTLSRQRFLLNGAHYSARRKPCQP